MADKQQIINSYDIDGVITIGLTPRPEDIIITGRSYQEAPETLKFLHERGIFNQVFFSPLEYGMNTREESGEHKARILSQFDNVGKHFEDDEVQKNIIERELGKKSPVIILISHDLTNKEIERHRDW